MDPGEAGQEVVEDQPGIRDAREGPGPGREGGGLARGGMRETRRRADGGRRDRDRECLVERKTDSSRAGGGILRLGGREGPWPGPPVTAGQADTGK